MGIRRVVRGADGVHVHLLDQVHIVDAHLPAGSPACCGPKGMVTDTPELDFHTIDINTVTFPDFNGAKANLFGSFVDNCSLRDYCESDVVEVWEFRIPGFYPLNFPGEVYFTAVFGNS